MIFIPRLCVYRSQSGYKSITWEFAPQWASGLRCNLSTLSASEADVAFCLQFLASVSLDPPCVCALTPVEVSACAFVLIPGVPAHPVCLSRSGCDTVAANYRS